jgi:ribonuclease HII
MWYGSTANTAHRSLVRRVRSSAETVEFGVAAASILAKTDRDTMLVKLDREYPCTDSSAQGLFHAGHLPPSRHMTDNPAHRRSFAPVTQIAIDSDDVKIHPKPSCSTFSVP